MATNRSWTAQDGGERQEDVQYHRIVAWTKLAEICGKYLKKGSKVYVQGRLQTRKWQTKDGQDRETTEIVAENLLMLSSSGAPREDAGNENQYAYPKEEISEKKKEEAPAASADTGEAPQVQDVSDDIPF